MGDIELDAEDRARAGVHTMWAGVAGAWAEYADDADRRAAAVTEAMLEGAAVGPGHRVLELACGPGGAGFAAAARVQPGGAVVLSDVADEMVAVAAARARVRDLPNVCTMTLDLEAIDQPDRSYDRVLCRDGLMFALDPPRAVREMHRVLRDDGRIAVVVWGPRERNPWLSIVLDAASAQLGMPVPPPGVPGPFSLDDAGRLGGLFVAAGFVEVDVRELDVPLRTPSFDTFWQRTSALAGPVSGIIAGLAVEDRTALVDRARIAVEPYRSSTGVELPGVALLVTAARA